MQRKIKILHCLEGFFPTERAGTEVYVLNLCTFLMEHGFDNAVLISRTNGQQDYVYDNIPVFTFKIPKTPSSSTLSGLKAPEGSFAFETKVLEIKPDIINFHSFGRGVNSFHLKRASELKIKTVYTPHLASAFCVKGDLRLYNESTCDGKVIANRCAACFLHSKGIDKRISRYLSPFFTLISRTVPRLVSPGWLAITNRFRELERVKKHSGLTISIAKWIKEAFDLNDIPNYHVPQGVNAAFTNRLGQSASQKRKVQRKVKFLFVGRMYSIKGFHLIVEAIQLLKHDPWMELHVITIPILLEDNYYQTHKTWAEKKENVFWNENLSPIEISNYLKHVDCVILPSISEMAPLASLEALACKVPILCSDIPAFREQVATYKGGFFFKRGDAKDLSEVLLSIKQNPQLLQEFSGSIINPPSFDEVFRLLIDQYQQLLSAK